MTFHELLDRLNLTEAPQFHRVITWERPNMTRMSAARLMGDRIEVRATERGTDSPLACRAYALILAKDEQGEARIMRFESLSGHPFQDLGLPTDASASEVVEALIQLGPIYRLYERPDAPNPDGGNQGGKPRPH